ncbi:uncharacterized protein LOC132182155 [Corylus avellana]|uniref:uncharacterized protein LOC132182155 n=1 Tax=Corylus avellana TaxID=13451 RepID=UPI00286A3067|nr:uncharacterized protein LOC132182155 [Corylus avellana]
MSMNTDDQYLELEGGGDDDDHNDVLFADIRRQILLLTADEDEDVDVHKDKQRNSISPVRRSSSSLAAVLQPGSYFNWWEKDNTNTVPAWLVSLWRSNNGNGTGVFIPQIVRSRRHYKPAGRMNSQRRVYKRVENKYS